MEDNENISGENNLEVAAPLTDDTNLPQVEKVVKEQEEKTVPLAALQSEREKRQKLENDLNLVKEHIALMQANQNNTKKEDPINDLSDDDVMTVGEFKKISNNLAISLEEMRIAQKYPDYNEVITKYLPEVIDKAPKLKKTLQQTQDFELAYYLAKNSDSYRENMSAKKKSGDAQRILENSQKSGSLSSMGSASPISIAKRYKEMSDEEFMQEVERNLG